MKYFLALISAAIFIGCDYADKTPQGNAHVIPKKRSTAQSSQQ